MRPELTKDMKKTLILVASAAILASACGRPAKLQRDQEQYEVVQEGSAGAVSSTISAPGETPPPMPTLTGTNADTTTAFTLPNTTMPTTSNPPGTIAGTLPQPTGGIDVYYPRDAGVPRTAPRPRPTTPPPTEPPLTTTTAEPPPPSTDTTSTTAPADQGEEPPETAPATTTTQ